LFNNVAGIDIDSRIIPTVDNLAEFFNSTNRNIILKEYGHRTQNNDPLIHFYETFLAAYDKDLRTKRGVYYTPAPVVSFMVDSVDKILKDFFQIKKGLADASMTKKKVKIQRKDKRTADGHKYTEADHHRVQILDPATGTGTFLANIVDYIYTNNFKQNSGIWSEYVNEHLIPRLNGFELLMAPYSMAHLKVGLFLEETGYVSKNPKRLKIYLTNSMEEEHPSSGQLFANWLSNEANQASQVKRDTPIMCVIGNPPYSGESSNKSDWIMKLMEDYKKEPGETIKLDEKNPKWINDDYVKFIRYSQELIEKNGEGIIAFINNHSFLDNPTFRGMRWRLLKTFDKIFVLDLHGNSKKKEKCPDGSKDENVFDIQQGVSINFFIKTGEKKKDELGSVYHSEIYGKRNVKYDFLSNHNIKTVQYEEIKNIGPNYYFIPRDYTAKEKYDEGFSVDDLFLVRGVGLTTAHDDFVINSNKSVLIIRFKDFKSTERDAVLLHQKFDVKWKKGWDILKGYDNLKKTENIAELVEPIAYRPFDIRYILYEDKLVWRTVRQVMRHFLHKDNISLSYHRREELNGSFAHIFVSKYMTEHGFTSSKTTNTQAPLYLYKTDFEGKLGNSQREPNFNRHIVQRISDKLGLYFKEEQDKSENTFAPINLLDYIYAILHSPAYREKYRDFLKTDFPKVPYPNDQEVFWKLVKYGKELRKLHLMEEIPEDLYNIGFPFQGDNIITKTFTKTNPGYEIEKENDTVGKVWINDNQYFSNVPKIAWDFFIGAYQPAQKWLKDRKGQKLSYDDIMHYQKIITVLSETDRIMREIDEVKLDSFI
jgi:predicted helicase